jgi:hypothetical protein
MLGHSIGVRTDCLHASPFLWANASRSQISNTAKAAEDWSVSQQEIPKLLIFRCSSLPLTRQPDVLRVRQLAYMFYHKISFVHFCRALDMECYILTCLGQMLLPLFINVNTLNMPKKKKDPKRCREGHQDVPTHIPSRLPLQHNPRVSKNTLCNIR